MEPKVGKGYNSMRILARITGALLAITMGFVVGTVSVCATEVEQGSEESKEILLFAGSAEATGQDRELTFLFSEHVGGKFNAAAINEDSYFYAEVECEIVEGEVPAYLALASASGGKQWVAVYPDEVGVTEDGNQTLIFSYENFAQAFGTNFTKLDIIYMYSNTTGTVKLRELSYVPGMGEPVDTGDGTWDKPLTGIAFIGDSIVQNPIFNLGDWNTVLDREDCVNYGIGGQTTVEVVDRWGDLLKGDYDKIVILCGINDLGHGKPLYVTIANYREMFEITQEVSPDTEILVISVLPTTDVFFKDGQDQILYMNAALKNIIKEYDYVTFVDCHSAFVEEDGYCNPAYVGDGLHPNKEGYEVIASILTPYLDGTVEKVETASEVEETEGEELSTTAVSAALVLVIVLIMLGIYFLKTKSQPRE